MSENDLQSAILKTCYKYNKYNKYLPESNFFKSLEKNETMVFIILTRSFTVLQK